jgi:hypothetical protein
MDKLMLGLNNSFDEEEHGYYNMILLHIFCFTQHNMV